jgi:hypothetical protein
MVNTQQDRNEKGGRWTQKIEGIVFPPFREGGRVS